MAFVVHVGMDDLSRLDGALEALGKSAPLAVMRAMNHTLDKARTRMITDVRKEYNIKAGDVRKRMRNRRATVSKLVAELISDGPRIPMIKFSPTPKTPGARPPVGVSVKVRKSAGREVLPGGFIARGGMGVNVFKRVRSKARLPIRILFGPSVPQMLGDVSDEIQGWAVQTVSDRLRHEVAFLFQEAR